MTEAERDKAVARLADVVDFLAVQPLGMLARITGDPPAAGGRVDLQLKRTIGFLRSEVPHEFRIMADFRIAASTGAERPPYVRLRYSVVAQYRSAEGEFEDAVLQRFAETNGMIHLWPYARAYVAATLGQLGLPPIALPVFRIKRAKPRS